MRDSHQRFVTRRYFSVSPWLLCAAMMSGGCSGSGGGSGDQVISIPDGAVSDGIPSFTDDTKTNLPSSDGQGTAVDIGGVAPKPQCQSDAECGQGWACDCHQRCVAVGQLVCVEDKNCGSGAFCNLCTGYCQSVKEPCEICDNSSECKGQGTACYDLAAGGRVCGLTCLSDVGCPVGFACIEIEGVKSKQCVPKSGTCAQPGACNRDDQCPFPLICNRSQQVCAAGCPDDASCPGESVCQAGHCVPPCDDVTNPCPAGQQCDSGHCKVPGGCVSSSECPEKETYCDLSTLKCISGCVVDFDCKQTSKVCVGGRCVDKPCPGNYYCAFGEICDFTTGECEPATGPYCAKCDQQNDVVCSSPGTQNVCVGFQDEDGNTSGDFCLVQCGSDNDNPCPQGYACKEIEIQEGDKRNVCFRNCAVPPVGVP